MIASMSYIEERARQVITEAWGRLPYTKLEAAIRHIVLKDLGEVNGQYDARNGIITLNRRLFQESGPENYRMIDYQGNDPPKHKPFVSRALHTTIHELAHALGEGTYLDRNPAWLALSQWEETPEDRLGSGRYFENRPGWGQGPSPWRYSLDAWFPREYSKKSPYEDFADCLTYRALQWYFLFLHPSTEASAFRKLAYMSRYVWESHIRPTDLWREQQSAVLYAVRERFKQK